MAASLTQDALREGADFIRHLDAEGVIVTGAAWVHAGDVHPNVAWLLFILSPEPDTEGSKRFRDLLFAHFGWLDPHGTLSPFDVVLGSLAEYAYRDLVQLASSLPKGEIADVAAAWRGMILDQVYVYRLGAPRDDHLRPRRSRRAASRRDAA